MAGELPGVQLTPEQERERALKAARHAAQFYAGFYVLARFSPEPRSRAVGQFMTGLAPRGGPTNVAGRLTPTSGIDFVLNAAPVPIGYVNPELFGLPKDFYIPPRVTPFIPAPVDHLGLGTREARISDELQRQQAMRPSILRAQTAVQGEPVETLQALAAGRGGPTRAGVIIATSGAGLVDLQAAANAELLRRQQALPEPPAEPGRLTGILAAAGLPNGPAVTVEAPVPPADVPANIVALNALVALAAANPPDP